MATENMAIIQQVLSEDRNFDEIVTTDTVLLALSKIDEFDQEIFVDYWKTRRLERSLFGTGFLDSLDLEINAMNAIVRIFSRASHIVLETKAHPVDALISVLTDMRPDMETVELFDFLNGLIECETLANWALWCPLENR